MSGLASSRAGSLPQLTELYWRARSNVGEIYWGAYLGTPDEILISGKLREVADEIERVRKAARLANGWIMDTYLLRKP